MKVEVLFGQLERSVAIWINSTETSTATPNQGGCVRVHVCWGVSLVQCVCVHVCVCLCVCVLTRTFYITLCYVLIGTFLRFCTDFAEVSRLLTFDAERTTDFVGIGIFHDFEREIVMETIDLQLSFVEEERGGGLLLLPNQATISIADNDGG